MSRADVITMARRVWGEQSVLPFDDLERFAAMVAAAEREACAKECEEWGAWNKVAQDCAAGIRARGTP